MSVGLAPGPKIKNGGAVGALLCCVGRNRAVGNSSAVFVAGCQESVPETLRKLVLLYFFFRFEMLNVIQNSEFAVTIPRRRTGIS